MTTNTVLETGSQSLTMGPGAGMRYTTGTANIVSNAVTLNSASGVLSAGAISEPFTFTLTNSFISTTSIIMVREITSSSANLTSSAFVVTPHSGSATIEWPSFVSGTYSISFLVT